MTTLSQQSGHGFRLILRLFAHAGSTADRCIFLFKSSFFYIPAYIGIVALAQAGKGRTPIRQSVTNESTEFGIHVVNIAIRSK